MLKIALTGGPCSGKTCMSNRLIQILEERSYKVITVPESASLLISNGIKPSKALAQDDFQRLVLEMQLANESFFCKAAEHYDKVIVIFDRGIMDGCAYMEKNTAFARILAERGLTAATVHNRYDAVFHLVTAADGAEECYTWNNSTHCNNRARFESPTEAREMDKKTLNAWIGHPHLRVFDNTTDFEGKVHRVTQEILALLGEPTPMEIERKFLCKMPTEEQMRGLGCVSKTDIVQTYLTRRDSSTERRVRRRGNAEGGFSFYYTEKTNVSCGTRIENERKISSAEYLQLLAEADNSLHRVSKTRYCFVYGKKYFEMDVYPFDNEYATVEVELCDIKEPMELPPLDFVMEVTDDVRFKNATLAKNLSFNLSAN